MTGTASKPDCTSGLPFRVGRRTLLGGAEAAGLFALAGFLSPQAQAKGDAVRQIFQQALPNLPGKALTAVVVEYAPGGKSPPHRHDPSASIFAYVLSGSIRSQVEGGEASVYQAGQSWFEAPGAHHLVSENASATEPASLLAVLVADVGAKLTVYDG